MTTHMATQQMPSRNQFDYQTFVLKWEDVFKANFKPTVQAYTEWVNSEKQKDSLSFSPLMISNYLIQMKCK